MTGVNRAANIDGFDPAVHAWINRDAFRAPGPFRFGTAARGYTDLRAPSLLTENFGVLKRFAVKERFTVTVRGELFNAFNRTVFGAPQGNVSNALFGRITGQANAPRNGQVALRLDF